MEGDSHWGTYKSKKKKTWRGTHTGGPIKKRKRKDGGGLTLGDLEKQEKEMLEGDYTGGPIKTRKRKAEGGLTLEDL